MRAPEHRAAGHDPEADHRLTAHHQPVRTRRRALVVALVSVVLLVAGCGADPANDDAPPVSSADAADDDGAAATPTATTTGPEDDPTPARLSSPSPEPLRFQTQSFDVAELNLAVADAHDAYLEHRKMFDAAARTGFTDETLVERLVATADAAVKDGIYALAEQLTAQGLVVNGGTEVVGIELAWLHIPGSGTEGLQVEFNSCVLIAGTVEDADGNPREDLTEDGHSYITARMAQDGERWILWSQLESEEECPAHLLE